MSGQGTRVKSAQRILDILEFLANSTDRRGATATGIATALRIPKSSIHYLLQLLVDRHYLESNADTKRYKLGLRIFEVGSQYVAKTDLYDAANPVLEAINRSTGEATTLDVLRDRDIITIAREEPLYRFRLRTALGDRVPAHASATGKVLLSGLEDDELAARYAGSALEKYTDKTIDSFERLMDAIRQARSNGVVYNREELFIGSDSVAVPVRDRHSRIVAALAVVVPTSRSVGGHLDRLARLLKVGGEIVSARLGYKAGEGERCLDPSELTSLWNVMEQGDELGRHPKRG